MNKFQRLVQSLIRLAALSFVVVLGCVGIYLFTDSLVDDSETQKAESARNLNANQSQVTNMNMQLNKSGLAEKRYLATQGQRTNTSFTADINVFKDYLRDAKARYRLSNSLKLSLTNDKVSTNKDFAETNYEVVEHPGMKLEFGAISDVHLFSFIEELTHDAPGFVRIDHLNIKRMGDIDTNTVTQMSNGGAPYLVDAQIEFNWIVLREKKAKPKNPTQPANAGTAP